MPAELKRMRYFDGLFLKQEEFRLDQNYNQRMRRLHNRHLHGHGIVWGLEVQEGPSLQEIAVTPGMAIDLYNDPTYQEETGREIMIPDEEIVDLSGYAPGDEIYVWVKYDEQQADVVADRGGSEPIHWLESGVIVTDLGPPVDPQINLVLGKVILSDSALEVEEIVTEENGVSLRTELGSVGGGGSSSVSGASLGKNYVRNPGGESSGNHWTSAASLNLTFARTAVAGEVLSGTFSFQVNSNAGVLAETDFIAIGMSAVDEEDKNQLFAVELSFKGLSNWDTDLLKVVVRDTTNDIDIIPNPNVLPGGQGKYRGVFTTTDSTTYELRLVALQDATVFSVAVDSVRVGPNNTVVGPAIGDWTPYDLTITSIGAVDPVKADSPVVDQAYWRRVGDSMEIMYNYRHTDNTGAVAGDNHYNFSIPAGYTIDLSKLPGVIDPVELMGPTVGVFSMRQSAGTRGFATGHVLVSGATVVQLFDNNDYGGAIVGGGSSSYNIVAATVEYSFRATVPIAEWSSDIVLSESRAEYVYNMDDADGDDTTSFASGEIGGLVPIVTGNDKKKRVKFSRQYRHIRLEVQPGGTGQWIAVGDSIYNYQVRNFSGTDEYFGMQAERVSDVQWDVHFGHDGHAYGNALTTRTWADERLAGTRWRMVGSDNPQFVETAPREILAAESAELTPANNNIWFAFVGNSLSLPPGEWLLNGTVRAETAGTPAYQGTLVLWSTQNGDDTGTPPPILPEIVSGYGRHSLNASGANGIIMPAPAVVVRNSTERTVYLNATSNMGAFADARIRAYLSAVRLS